MAEELQFSSRPDNKRKYDDQNAVPPSATAPSPSPDNHAADPPPPSYNYPDGIQLARQRVQEVANRLFGDAEAKRPWVENGGDTDDSISSGMGFGSAASATHSDSDSEEEFRKEVKGKNPNNKLFFVEEAPCLAEADKRKIENDNSMTSYDENKRKRVKKVEREEEVPLPPCFGKQELEELEEVFQYRLNDRMMIVKAFTHGSYYYPSNPRPPVSYEFEMFVSLGEDVLKCLTTGEILKNDPRISIAHIPATFLDTTNLAWLAIGNNLHHHLRHKLPYLNYEIADFMYVERCSVPIVRGDHPTGVLADIVKSVIGAIYMDAKSCPHVVAKVLKRLAEESYHDNIWVDLSAHIDMYTDEEEEEEEESSE